MKGRPLPTLDRRSMLAKTKKDLALPTKAQLPPMHKGYTTKSRESSSESNKVLSDEDLIDVAEFGAKTNPSGTGRSSGPTKQPTAAQRHQIVSNRNPSSSYVRTSSASTRAAGASTSSGSSSRAQAAPPCLFIPSDDESSDEECLETQGQR
eukprot:scaffold87172_cov49-Attheya_sp.AAC.2